MASRDTVWVRSPHTEGKHLVLRRYLQAWYPILGSWNGRIVFIDGFAGPGEYQGGEEGSPIIALRSLAEHSGKGLVTAEVVFLFVEADTDRADHLAGLVARYRDELPSTAKVEVRNARFDEEMSAELERIEQDGKQLAPAFVMLDPFGVSDTPMAVIERILKNERSEVYVSFMYEAMNRFIGTPEFEPHLDSLFGTEAWRSALDMEGEERKRFLYSLYADQLRAAGAKHVVHFDLYRNNRLVYGIFFGTQSLKGCDKMKDAIWNAAPDGGYLFRGSATDQLLLDVNTPDFEVLARALETEFGEQEWVTIEEIQDFVRSDAVIFHCGQLKKPVLKPMERAGRVEVDDDTRKRRFTYPSGCRLRFVAD